MIKEVKGTKETHLVRYNEFTGNISCTCKHGSKFPNAYQEWLAVSEMSEKIGLCKHIKQFIQEQNAKDK